MTKSYSARFYLPSIAFAAVVWVGEVRAPGLICNQSYEVIQADPVVSRKLGSDRMRESFFADRMVSERQAQADQIRRLTNLALPGVRDPHIAFLGDYAGKNDAIKNAQQTVETLLQQGYKNPLVVSGHGFATSNSTGEVISSGLVVAKPDQGGIGPNSWQIPANGWGALTLRDVLTRAGYSLENYDVIALAACHTGQCAMEFSEISTVPVLGVPVDGRLHYSSGTVQRSAGPGGVFPEEGDPGTVFFPPGILPAAP